MATDNPVPGYVQQSPETMRLIQEHRLMEERLLRHIENRMWLDDNGQEACDQRAASIARTKVQEAFMWLNRAITRPPRIGLPEDTV
jgi:hypothetical protein